MNAARSCLYGQCFEEAAGLLAVASIGLGLARKRAQRALNLWAMLQAGLLSRSDGSRWMLGSRRERQQRRVAALVRPHRTPSRNGAELAARARAPGSMLRQSACFECGEHTRRRSRRGAVYLNMALAATGELRESRTFTTHFGPHLYWSRRLVPAVSGRR